MGQIGKSEMETEAEEDVVKSRSYEGRSDIADKIKPGNATFMQVTSDIPFHLFLTAEESL